MCTDTCTTNSCAASLGIGIPLGDAIILPKLQVVSIERVHNPRLFQGYAAELDAIKGLNGLKHNGACPAIPQDDDLMPAPTYHSLVDGKNPLNEFFLFHGVPHTLRDRIAAQGFDLRFAGSHFGTLFGFGVYFAQTVSKSDIYTSPSPKDGTRTMYLARTCLGHAYTTKTSMGKVLMAPAPAGLETGPDGPLDSVRAERSSRGGCVEFLEYIVYKNTQTFPEYRFTYKHMPGCQCTHCHRA